MPLQRGFHVRLNPLDAYLPSDFIARYRITHSMFMELLHRLETITIPSTCRPHAIPTSTQSNGMFQTVFGPSNRISQYLISRSIATITDLISFRKQSRA